MITETESLGGLRSKTLSVDNTSNANQFSSPVLQGDGQLVGAGDFLEFI